MSVDKGMRSRDADLADAEIVSALLRLSSKVRTRLSVVLEPLGMSWARYEILDELIRCGKSSYGDLARSLARHRTSVKVTVSALNRDGHVALHGDPTHPQRIMFHATESGVATHARAAKLLAHARNKNPELRDRDAVLEVLHRLENEWIARL